MNKKRDLRLRKLEINYEKNLESHTNQFSDNSVRPTSSWSSMLPCFNFYFWFVPSCLKKAQPKSNRSPNTIVNKFPMPWTISTVNQNRIFSGLKRL